VRNFNIPSGRGPRLLCIQTRERRPPPAQPSLPWRQQWGREGWKLVDLAALLVMKLPGAAPTVGCLPHGTPPSETARNGGDEKRSRWGLGMAGYFALATEVRVRGVQDGNAWARRAICLVFWCEWEELKEEVQEAVLLETDECVDKNELGEMEPPREHVSPSVLYIYVPRTLAEYSRFCN
jgi:hypothetical protein